MHSNASIQTKGRSLAAIQSDLMASIRCADAAIHAHDAKGWQIYRANVRFGAANALRVTFPVLEQVLGRESFDAMARHFWHEYPPILGDWAQWGADLPAFLAVSTQLADTPYVSDLARLEWQLHAIGGSCDAPIDTASFALLTQFEPQELCLQLGSAQCMQAQYPIVSIHHAHMGRSKIESIAPLLLESTPEMALVWRNGFAPVVRLVAQEETRFLQSILAGQSLSAAMDVAEASFDFSVWLTDSYQSGLLLGVTKRLV